MPSSLCVRSKTASGASATRLGKTMVTAWNGLTPMRSFLRDCVRTDLIGPKTLSVLRVP